MHENLIKKSDTYEDPLKNGKFKILNSTETEYVFIANKLDGFYVLTRLSVQDSIFIFLY